MGLEWPPASGFAFYKIQISSDGQQSVTLQVCEAIFPSFEDAECRLFKLLYYN
jgi:hypothetical protein